MIAVQIIMVVIASVWCKPGGVDGVEYCTSDECDCAAFVC
jgi:hypothetical protein